MRGYYFINTDLRNTRAHTSQVLNTVSSLQSSLPVELVSPRYPGLDIEGITKRHDLPRVPEAVFLWNFGIRDAGALSFVFFNIPAIVFLLVQKLRGEASFIYVRASYFLPLILAAFLLHVPCFFETHRRPVTLPERFRENLIVRMSRGLVVVSEHVREEYARHGKSMIVVHDAVSLERFAVDVSKEEARSKLGLAPEQLLCVYTGSVSRLKGINYVVDAARELPHVTFLLAGRITADYRGATLPANVTLMGEKEQKELPTLLRAADVLLLPHPDNDYSQSPMKLFEYMASGVPLVSSRLPSLLEILNERNSTLIEPDSGEALAAGIRHVLSDKTAAERLARHARADVGEHTWEARGKSIAAFIRSHVG